MVVVVVLAVVLVVFVVLLLAGLGDDRQPTAPVRSPKVSSFFGGRGLE
jgi:hypothetical protein